MDYFGATGKCGVSILAVILTMAVCRRGVGFSRTRQSRTANDYRRSEGVVGAVAEFSDFVRSLTLGFVQTKKFVVSDPQDPLTNHNVERKQREKRAAAFEALDLQLLPTGDGVRCDFLKRIQLEYTHLCKTKGGSLSLSNVIRVCAVAQQVLVHTAKLRAVLQFSFDALARHRGTHADKHTSLCAVIAVPPQVQDGVFVGGNCGLSQVQSVKSVMLLLCYQGPDNHVSI